MISQNEARRLRKRVRELETERRMAHNSWVQEYPGGMHLGSIKGDWLAGHVQLARRLRHAVVATANDSQSIHFYALPIA